MGIPRRRQSGPQAATAAPQVVGEHLPLLAQFLMAESYDDGSVREPGSVTFFVDGCHVKIAMNEKGESMVGFATLDTAEQLAEQIESLLREQRVDWRVSRRQSKK